MYLFKCRKIPKISLGAYIFQRSFLRGLFLEGFIFGGAYVRGGGELAYQNRLGLYLEGNLRPKIHWVAHSWKEINVRNMQKVLTETRL